MQVALLPSWDAMHPLIIHFPIVLLLLVPLFVVIAVMMRSPKNSPYMTTALLLLLLGTGSLFLAGSSGEEAAKLADRGGAAEAVLAIHEKLAFRSEYIFTILSIVFLAIYIWPILRKRAGARLIQADVFSGLMKRWLLSAITPFAFLAVYGIGVISLVNTAHAGGRLVHEFGLHAILPASQDAYVPATESTGTRDEEGD